MVEIYAMALSSQTASGVIRAKRHDVTLGSMVVYTNDCSWAVAMPASKDSDHLMGGISSPVISPSVGEYSTLLHGLVLLGIRYLKNQQVEAVVLDHVSLLIAWPFSNVG